MLSSLSVQLNFDAHVNHEAKKVLRLAKKIRDLFMRPCERPEEGSKLAKHRNLIGRIPSQIDIAF